MMVPNFLYSNSYHFLKLHIIIIIIIIIGVLTYFSSGGKATESTIFNISKQNLINILFHRGGFVRD